MPTRPFRAYAGDEPYVFVCYAHGDAGVVYPEIGNLAADGIPIWYDEGISPSSEWSDSLAEAIEKCSVFLMYVSPRSAASEHCRRELSYALDRGCDLLVVMLEPTRLSGGLRLSLGNRQALVRHESSEDVYFEKLRRAIRSALAPDAPAVAESSPMAGPLHSGERRQLTVLATDIVSEPVAVDIDPEDWADVVERFHDCVRAAVDRYEGHVAQFTSEGALVYFGHPIAHENDAERALRCGLALIESTAASEFTAGVAAPVAARVAINSGTVLLRSATDSAAGALATGATPTIAVRMLESAAPNAVLLSGRTLEVAADRVEVERVGDVQPQGVAESVEIYRLIAVTTGNKRSFDSRQTPFVGRDLEMAQLMAMQDRALRGTPVFVLIAGEPGIGKSRLLHEFHQRTAVAVRRHDLRCSPFEIGSPFYPFIETLRDALGLDGTSDSEQRAQRFVAGMKRIGIVAPERRRALADVLAVDGVESGGDRPSARRKATIEGLLQWLMQPGGPTFVCIEDAHWLDPSSLEVIDRLFAATNDLPLLLIMTARREFEPDLAWRGRLNVVNVERLLDSDVERLIAEVRGTGPDDTTQQLALRSDGIPLFAEAIARSSNGDDIPATLQELLYQQFARLGDTRGIAHVAAVIGREFDTELLSAAAAERGRAFEDRLGRLVDAGFLVSASRSPGERYAFKHALIQEIAYESMPRKERREVHARVAALLTTRFKDAYGGHVAALHFARAGDHVNATALLLEAGRAAFRRSAHVEASKFLRQGLDEAEAIDDQDKRVRQEIVLQTYLGETLSVLEGYAAESAQHAFQRARTLATSIGRLDASFRAVSRLQAASLLTSHVNHSKALAAELRSLAGDLDDPQAIADADTMSGVTAYAAGEFDAALRYFEAAIEYHLHEHAVGVFGSVAAHADAYQITNLWLIGRPDAAKAHAQAALTRARAHDHAFNEAAVLNCQGSLFVLRGEFEAATDVADRLERLAETHGFALHEGNAHCLRGAALAGGGDAEAGIAALLDGIGKIGATGQATYAIWYQQFLAAACLACNRVAEADTIVTNALATAAEIGVHNSTVELLRLKAEISGARGDIDAAFDRLAEALEMSEREHALGWKLRVAMSRFTLDRDPAGARRLLESCCASFTEGSSTADVRRARSMLKGAPM